MREVRGKMLLVVEGKRRRCQWQQRGKARRKGDRLCRLVRPRELVDWGGRCDFRFPRPFHSWDGWENTSFNTCIIIRSIARAFFIGGHPKATSWRPQHSENTITWEKLVYTFTHILLHHSEYFNAPPEEFQIERLIANLHPRVSQIPLNKNVIDHSLKFRISEGRGEDCHNM